MLVGCMPAPSNPRIADLGSSMPVATKGGLTLEEVNQNAATPLIEIPRASFIEFYPCIYGAWLSSLPITAGHEPVQSVIAAFDFVLPLARSANKSNREISSYLLLPLRFGYFQLMQATDAFNGEARRAGRSCSKTHHIGAISIDAYLKAKGATQSESLTSEQAVYATDARRMCDLTVNSPLMLSVYLAEAIA
jgi:hypothetical protein